MADARDGRFETVIRRGGVAVVVLALCACVLGGCFRGGSESDGTDSAGEGTMAQDSSPDWETADDTTTKRAGTYLRNDGSHLLRFSTFASSLENRLDDKAYNNRCAKLRRQWTSTFSRSKMINVTERNPDPLLGRLLTSQFGAVERSLRRCVEGKRAASEGDAAAVARLDELVEHRLDELGVSR